MTSEEKIHAGLLAVTLFVAAGLLRQTGNEASPSALPAPSHPPANFSSKQVTEAELQQAITQLDARLELHHRSGGSRETALFELQALGYERISRGPQHSRMTALLLSSTTDKPLSSAARTIAAETLAVLLESGWKLQRNIPFAPDKRPLRQWVTDTLNGFEPGQPQQHVDAAELNLLAMAQMAGLTQFSQRLGDLTRKSFLELRQEYRHLGALRGRGNVQAAGLNALRSMKSAPNSSTLSSLKLSSSALRAAAIAQEKSLKSLATRHLRDLAFRAEFEIVHHHLALATASNPSARQAARIDALESLGRLGQALHAATLVQQPEIGRPLGKVLALPMLRLGGELISLLGSSEWQTLSGVGQSLSPQSLRAASQALRALRTAKIAVP